MLRRIFIVLIIAFGFAAGAQAQSATSFHYTGTLTDSQAPSPTGLYDFQLKLFDGSDAGAAQVGAPLLLPAVQVTFGYFALDVDFGADILAPHSWIEIAVRPSGSGNYETLAPRQAVGHVPLALYAEATDWSGVANVPSALKALGTPTPSQGIGKLVLNPQTLGVSVKEIVVNRVAFSVSRPLQSGLPQPPQVHDLEVWIQPQEGIPGFLNLAVANTKITTVQLYLDVLGNDPTSSDFIAQMSNAYVSGASLEPGTGSTPQLLHLTFTSESLLLRSTADSQSPNYVAETWNALTKTASTPTAACPAVLSLWAHGSAPSKFNGYLTVGQPSVFDFTVDVNQQLGTNTVVFQPAEMSVQLDPANPVADRKLAVCAFALAISNTKIAPDPTWSVYPDPLSDWTTQVEWTKSYLTGFVLDSDGQGATQVGVSLYPTTQLTVRAQTPQQLFESCYNVQTLTSC